MHIFVFIVSVGDSRRIGELLPLCDFFDCPVLQCPYIAGNFKDAART